MTADGLMRLHEIAAEIAVDREEATLMLGALRALAHDLPKHFGFLMDWHLIGPFDNRKRGGFEVAFPPESGVDLAGQYDGREMKAGEKTIAKWVPYSSSNQFGMVDFNKPVGMFKEVTGYAFTEFNSPAERDAFYRWNFEDLMGEGLRSRLGAETRPVVGR